MITDRQKFTMKTLYGISVRIVGINSKSFRWPVHSVQEAAPDFLWRPMSRRCGLTTWQITLISLSRRQPINNHHRLMSNVTLGLVECRK